MSDFAGSVNISESLSANLHDYQSLVDSALRELHEADIINRIWKHDHTVWKPEPAEIGNRLDWLHSPEQMGGSLDDIAALVDEIERDGYAQAVLLGMGGSSLAPEVFRLAFGVSPGYLDLFILDSTDPGAVLSVEHQLDLNKTLFIVSTKSGGTVETLSLFKYFYTRVAEAVKEPSAGAHFIAITDPGSGLVEVAEQNSFRKLFLNNPNIGGRYSALSYFGLVPAALLGMDIEKLLDSALKAAEVCAPNHRDNPAAFLGVTLGELARAGRDKLTLISPSGLAHFGAWLEQLIAESTGKEGKGIVPIDGEDVGAVENYSNDRLFVQLSLDQEKIPDDPINAIGDAGHPVIRIKLGHQYELGGQFFLWELATAIAGWRLQINPFDQPNVEFAKISARNMVAAYQSKGRLPDPAPDLDSDGVKVYTESGGSNPGDALVRFLRQVDLGTASGHGRSYIAIQAYVQSTDETAADLAALCRRLRDRFRLATTVGYGPRFLHSTGQLHKGDAGNGLFIQITAEDSQDIGIPDEIGSDESSMTFGLLKMAQALGDRQALLDADRKGIRFHLRDIHAGLKLLREAVESTDGIINQTLLS
ncbi:glucose-6-phosphate isomerase [bacterium]|nr:glucose-6-phosphate isomerase [bacterium]